MPLIKADEFFTFDAAVKEVARCCPTTDPNAPIMGLRLEGNKLWLLTGPPDEQSFSVAVKASSKPAKKTGKKTAKKAAKKTKKK